MTGVNFSVDEIYRSQVDLEALDKAINQTIKHQLHQSDDMLSVIITDDVHLRRLNKSYSGIDSATDVLSFISGEVDPDTGKNYLGDIVISYPQAAHQAKRGGHSVQDELLLLTIHGVLHLLGHDHVEPGEKQEMWDAQSTILQLLGCQISPP